MSRQRARDRLIGDLSIVAGMLSLRHSTPRRHALTWDGLDAEGRPAASGVYVCCVVADGQIRSRTMVRIR